MPKKTIIIGGGTFNHIRNHLSLGAPAFGSTAKKLHELLDGTLVLTKMADSFSQLVTNDDLKKYVDELTEDPSVGTIIFNAAVCDFECEIDTVEPGKHAKRLKTANGNVLAMLKPSDKIISNIRVKRPDIFLVGFKTTTDEDPEKQFSIALKMMKSTKCNLVLANDVVTRFNFIVTPEETAYSKTHDRDRVLTDLSEMIKLRQDLTYNKTIFTKTDSYDAEATSETFKTVLKFVIDNGGYIENNGNDFTPGHFCQRTGAYQFLSSQRKADHNLVFSEGMTSVAVIDDKFYATGARKPSVGARSQWLMLSENPGLDCIIHTHNPLKEGSDISVIPQRPFQCGSHECGTNTLNSLEDFDGIKAVFLDKHGVNILFSSREDPEKVIRFIKNNIVLGTKLGF